METLELVPSDAVRTIVGEVFLVMVKLQIRPVDGKWKSQTGARVTAIVGLSGPVDSGQPNFSVILETSEELALRITGATLKRPLTQWSHIVEDACGEIANMIAGNLKKHLIATHVLSLPTVIHGVDYEWGVPAPQVMQEQVFECGSEAFRVCVLQAQTDHPTP